MWLPGALSRDTLEALFTPFNGYLQMVSRLVAEPVAALPVEAYAPAMAIAGAAIVAACACVVWRASAGYFESRFLRGALVALVILLPVVGTNALATVTNSIWFLLYAGMWALLWRPRSRGETAVAAGVVALAALSNLGVVFLLPISLARPGAGDPRPPRPGDRRRVRSGARRPARVLGRRDRASRRGG